MALVSVIIPAYNQARYLGLAIQSVLDQTCPDFEIAVVDDGSTDETAAVARGFADPRLHYLYQANQGLSAARNTGLRCTTAPFVTFLDADDLFLPAKLALLAAELQAEPGLGLVAGQAVLIDEAGRPTGHPFESRLPSDSALLLLGNPLHVGSVMLRREWQARVGFFDEALRSYEDWDLWLRLAGAGCPMRCLNQPVSLYRFHTQQMTRNGRQMTAATFAVLDKVYTAETRPAGWDALREKAYSRADLRAAAQAFLAGSYAEAQVSLLAAVQRCPDLLDDDGQPLAAHFAAWIELPKTGDPLAFLEDIYAHLPARLAPLRRRSRQELSQAAMSLAFSAYHQGQRRQARRAVWRALRYWPGWITNRGALSILLRTLAAAR